MRFNTNVSANSKKSIELNNFLGVDFSSAPTNVSKGRASFAKNLISIDGVNQKRPGWEELFNFGEGHSVNGVFVTKFKRHSHIDEIIIVQVNGYLYKMTQNNGVWSASFIKVYTGDRLDYGYQRVEGKDFKSQAFLSNNRLYILGGGEYFVYYPREDNEDITEFVTTETIINSQGQFQEVPKIYNSGDIVEFNGYTYRCALDETNAKNNPPSGEQTDTDNWYYADNYYRLRRVINDEDTYIPTTTIGIMANESGDTSRSSLDKINLLASYRINKLRGLSLKKDNIGAKAYYFQTYDWIPIEGKTYYKYPLPGFESFEVQPVSNQMIREVAQEDLPEYLNTAGSPGLYYEKNFAYSFNLDATDMVVGKKITITITNKDGVITLENDTRLYGGSYYECFIFDEQNTQQGYIDWKAGILYLFESMDIEPVTDEDNIIVKFAPYNAEDTIRDCSFGCRFGYNGKDTLFLSGNKNYPNQDFYSYTVEEDFTYFPADNIQTFGSATSAVKAYLQVEDGTLAVLKEMSNDEPTIYFRKASYTTNNDGLTIIQYPVTPGTIGEGAVNAFTVGVLGGDKLFVSPNGIFGLTLAENITINERYARERDSFIRSELLKHDLSKAVATVYQGRYLLSVDGVCFVLDSRYKNTSKDEADDTFSYESWYWDNMFANCFCSHNNELYFGTTNGGLCRLKKDSYTDDTIKDLGVISITPESEGNYITVSEQYKDLIKNDATVMISLFKDKIFYITDYDGVNNFKIYDEEGIVSLGEYSETPTMKIVVRQPVIATWQSAILDLGLYDYSKCLDSLSVVLSPDFSGKVKFGYETKLVTLDLIAKQIKGAETEEGNKFFSFDNIDFDNFTFETAFASSYTKRLRERNINYIIFKAVMDDDKNSAIMSIKVDYTIYKKNRGVR